MDGNYCNTVSSGDVYEREVRFNAANDYVDIADPKEKQSHPVENKSKFKKYWRALNCFVVLLQLGIAVVGIYYISKFSSYADGINDLSKKTSESCLALKNSGVSTDGYYSIQPAGEPEPFKTYCDMTSAGGGWTLVATVHENDIKGKCTTGDQWFSNDLAKHSLYGRNWENMNSFGNVKEATSADYKNRGYSSIKASNLMIRHVPNKTPVDESKSRASLEYHTSNNFLTKYGGNLYTTYTQHYPMNPKTTVGYPGNIGQMADSIERISSNLTSSIPDFYKYEYGSVSDRLQNGGSNMFIDIGMLIYGYVACSHHAITYGYEYKCPSINSVLTSRKSYPFIALMGVTHANWQHHMHYRIQSSRFINESVQFYNGKMTNGNFKLQYRARCVYGGSIPSVCDVGFVVSNTKDWFSSSSVTVSDITTRRLRTYYYTIYINNYPKNVVFGYTMLSRTAGRLVSKDQLTTTLGKMLDTFKNYTWSIPCASNHLVVPVTYTIGESTLTNFVPPSMHHATTTGFLQIRAESYSGTYYAMCPAVKLLTCHGQFVCVGGVKNGYSVTDDCSDYADWDGRSNNPDFHHSKAYSHSTNDIESTMMIFYR